MKVYRARKDYYYENLREIHTEINLNNLIFKVNPPKDLKEGQYTCSRSLEQFPLQKFYQF